MLHIRKESQDNVEAFISLLINDVAVDFLLLTPYSLLDSPLLAVESSAEPIATAGSR